MTAPVPLAVDLDGTLVRTDLLLESVLLLVRRKPLTALRMPLWLTKGKAQFKQELARHVEPDVTLLPYREPLCALLREYAKLGCRLILVTASDAKLANGVAAHLGLFDQVLASDGTTNLKGEHKRARLVAEFGERGFDYAGNDRNDLGVWASARQAVLVGTGARLQAAAARVSQVAHVVNDDSGRLKPALRTLRAHHWLKNILLFVPLAAAHRIGDPALLLAAGIGAASFCLLASGLYAFNDLLDLEADRRHPRKRLRPLAAGELPLHYALAMIPLLLAAAFALAVQLPPAFVGLWALYFLITFAYTLRLKHVVMLDVIVLGGLYMLRILAGAAAVDIAVSRWVLGFSIFIFLSLALLKRYTEIQTMSAAAEGPVRIRDYETGDGPLLLALGASAGYLSVVILALYVESATAERLYSHNELMWLVCPVMLYWISYVWLMAHRNRMTYDPLVFAVRDRTSQILIVVTLAMLALAV